MDTGAKRETRAAERDAVSSYPTLLSPVSLGPLQLRNRVVSTSHQTTLVHRHLPTDELVAYHRARAAGGVGAIFLEATAVHPTGLLTPHTLGGYLPEIAGGYRRLVDALRGYNTPVLVQLFHGGREQISAPPRAPAVAPSAVPSPRYKSEPRALTLRELREVIDGYACATRVAHEGGIDGVEISMAHGYLAAQFFSPATNRRDDGYNGDLDSRLRFAREVIAAVRASAGPNMAVGVRLAASEAAEGLLDADACGEIAGALARDGAVDFVSLALGNSATYQGATWIAPPPPAAENAIVHELGATRSRVAGTPVIATTRIVDLEAAERILASGAADVVGMTRALIADPELVAKAHGVSDEPVIECIGCNQACIGHYHAGVPIGCVVNFRTGRELLLPPPTRTVASRQVLIIGGGPAGVAAAIEAAQWGDHVVLRERADQLGGQLRLAGHAPAHSEMWNRWSRSVHARLRRLGVEVEVGCEVRDACVGDSWDLVVLATGARPYQPPVPPMPHVEVVSAWETLTEPDRVTGPILIADWGGEWAGLDSAETLRRAGHEVTLACAAIHPGETLHQYQRNLYLSRLDAAGVEILHHTELIATAERVKLQNVFSGRELPLPAFRALVLAQGRIPDDHLWPAFENQPAAVRAGDVLGPRGLDEATLEGAMVASRNVEADPTH